MDIETLAAKLELAEGWKERHKLVRDAAKRASRADLEDITRLLGHQIAPVRLGAIEILTATRFRPSLKHLAAVTIQRTGEERVFAARALAHLAEPSDRKLLEKLARSWLNSNDSSLHGHAADVLKKIGVPAQESGPAGPSRSAPAGSAPGFGITSADPSTRKQAIAHTLAMNGEPERILVDALREPQPPGVKLDLVSALEELGADRFASAAIQLLRKPDGDLAALLARALPRHITRLSDQGVAQVRDALDQAHRNLAGDELARAAIEECMLVEPERSVESMVARADRISSRAALKLALAMVDLPRPRRLGLLGDLFKALERVPRRTLLFAETLHDAWPDLRPPRRTLLRQLLETACSDPLPDKISASILATIGQLYARVLAWSSNRGTGTESTAPTHLLAALDRRDEPEAALAAVAIYAAIPAESSAKKLAGYLDEPAVEVHDAARAALKDLSVPHVTIRVGDDDSVSVSPDYRTETGQRLIARSGSLETESGIRYALDGRGDPQKESDSQWGGCRCCERPRILVRTGRARPVCPVTGQSHLIDDSKPILEHGHPLGGCTVCESVRPLARHGAVIRCDECHTEHVERDGRYIKKRRRRRRPEGPAGVPPGPELPGNGAGDVPPGPLRKKDLPEPPSPSDLQLVEPTIRHAMAANVFVIGDTADEHWSGSGVIVARDGNELAILTNRHVVEDQTEDGATVLATIRVYTISGELVPATVVWRATRGLDLALIKTAVREPDRVMITELGEGSCLVGSRLFAIGNPLGLSWSYSSGTLAGFRNWKTRDDLDIRFIQSHVTMTSGSSGGGLYHEQGHLVGINSFGQGTVMGPGGDQNFSIAMPSVAAALRRERPTFAGKPLIT
ncbi:MAG: serine protease [Proteobacteria bacterium]|nr:serine protease [Pseudomonadota bacterium]